MVIVALTDAGSPLMPSFRSKASTNCAHVVSFVIPDIQRCSPCTQIGISSSESIDSDSSLISPVDCDDTEIDAIDPNEELDEEVDKVHLMLLSALRCRYCGRLFVRSSLITTATMMMMIGTMHDEHENEQAINIEYISVLTFD